MWNRRHRWLRRFAAGLAFAGLVVVPTAQAHQLQVSGGGSGADIVRPDDRAVRISPQPVDSTNVVRPDDRSVRFTPSGGELPQVVAAPSTGFDWGDAGIGASLAFGLMLLALGAALATRHANRKALAGA
jgi:hypothetical protein